MPLAAEVPPSVFPVGVPAGPEAGVFPDFALLAVATAGTGAEPPPPPGPEPLVATGAEAGPAGTGPDAAGAWLAGAEGLVGGGAELRAAAVLPPVPEPKPPPRTTPPPEKLLSAGASSGAFATTLGGAGEFKVGDPENTGAELEPDRKAGNSCGALKGKLGASAKDLETSERPRSEGRSGEDAWFEAFAATWGRGAGAATAAAGEFLPAAEPVFAASGGEFGSVLT
ncbi:MAG: hypothetical protein U1F66_08605 [bacterium]